LTTTKKEEKKERKKERLTERENAQQRQQKKRNRKVSPATPACPYTRASLRGEISKNGGWGGVGTYLFYQIENNFGLQKVRSAQFPPLNFSLYQL